MSHDAGERLRHQEAWELIPWYVNGTLVEDEAEQVADHLDRCPLCRREVAANRELAAALRAAEETPAAPDPRLERLLARLDEPLAEDAAAGDGLAPPQDLAPPQGPAPPWDLTSPRDVAPPQHLAPPRRGRPVWWAATPRPARRLLLAQLAAVLLLAVVGGWLVAVQQLSAPSASSLPGGSPAAPPATFRTLSQPSPDLPAAPGDGTVTVRLLFAAGTREAQMRRLLLAEGGRLVAGPSPSGVYTAAFAAPAGGGAALVERLRRAPAVELVERVRPRRGGGS